MKTPMFNLIICIILFPPNIAFAEKNKSSLNRCQANGDRTEVFIRTVDQGYRVNNKLTSRSLNMRSHNSYTGDYVIGLTSIESKTVFDVNGEVWDDWPTGGECFAPKIRIQLIYNPIDVFIGSEFREGSCTFNTILEHEMEHVKLYRESLITIETTIKEWMALRFQGKPIYGTKGTTRQALDAEIDNLWRPLIKAELAKLQIRQNEIDSEEKIDKVTWSCSGEIQNKFGFSFQGSRYH